MFRALRLYRLCPFSHSKLWPSRVKTPSAAFFEFMDCMQDYYRLVVRPEHNCLGFAQLESGQLIL
jgi:hypothetical protein